MKKPRVNRHGVDQQSRVSLASLHCFLCGRANTPQYPDSALAQKLLVDFAPQLGGKA